MTELRAIDSGSPIKSVARAAYEYGATYTLDIASGAKKQIAAALFAPSKPCWSADGRTIAIGALKAYTRRFREGKSG